MKKGPKRALGKNALLNSSLDESITINLVNFAIVIS